MEKEEDKKKRNEKKEKNSSLSNTERGLSLVHEELSSILLRTISLDIGLVLGFYGLFFNRLSRVGRIDRIEPSAVNIDLGAESCRMISIWPVYLAQYI